MTDMTGFGGLIERFDHVSLGVRDIRSVLPLLDFLGAQFLSGGDNVRGRFRWAQWSLPGAGNIELIQPFDDNEFLNRFLDGRGEGVHHLTFKVTDIEEAARRASELGFETTGFLEGPRWSEVFLHPKTTHGVVIQLAEWDDSDKQPPSLQDVLDGRALDYD